MFDPPLELPAGAVLSPTGDSGNSLIGAADLLASEFPQWMNLETGVLSRVLSSMGDILDIFGASVSRVVGQLSDPRTCYYSPVPQKLSNQYGINPGDLSVYYSFDGSTWNPAQNVVGLWQLFFADGPCAFISGTEAFLRNLEKATLAVTGAPSGENFLYTLPEIIPDGDVLFSLDYTLPARRWLRFEPDSDYRVGNSLLVPYPSGYVNVPLVSRQSNVQILWVSGASSGLTSGFTVSLSNHWDELASRSGLARRAGEDNLTLFSRVQSVWRHGSDFTKLGSLLGAARELGCVSFYTWDGFTPLPLPSGTTQVIVADLPQTQWSKESLTPSTDINVFTSDVRNPNYVQLYLEDLPVTPSGSSNGVFVMGSGFSVETFTKVEAEAIWENWSVSGNVLSATSNLARDNYFVAAISDINISALTDSSLISRLYSNNGLTPFAYDILSSIKHQSPFSYNNARWNINQFFDAAFQAGVPYQIPVGFID